MGLREPGERTFDSGRAEARRDGSWPPSDDQPLAGSSRQGVTAAVSAPADPAPAGWPDALHHVGIGREQRNQARTERRDDRSRGDIDTSAIISRSWARSLSSFSGGDGIVEYAINEQGDGFRYLPMSGDEQQFIHRAFAQLDELTGLSFLEASSLDEADIRVHCAQKLGGSAGLAYRRSGWFDVSWKDQKDWRLTRFEQHVILHEIAHALGLDHPYGRGGHPRYDTKDTVMSYNWRGNTNFTSTDILALQELWGS